MSSVYSLGLFESCPESVAVWGLTNQKERSLNLDKKCHYHTDRLLSSLECYSASNKKDNARPTGVPLFNK